MNVHGGQNPAAAAAVPGAAMGPQSTNPAALAAYKQQRMQFLVTLHNIFSNAGKPLPPTLTGVNVPFDPATSSWLMLQIPEVGCVRIAGKNVELFRFWRLIATGGGSAQVCLLHSIRSFTQSAFKPTILSL